MSKVSLEEQVGEALYEVIDPELNMNIMDLGLVYMVQVKENSEVYVRLTLTTPGCPLHDTIVGGVETVLYSTDEVQNVEVDLVWTPAWTPDKMSRRAKEMLMF
ncbi:metal-sulfur cluster assembly factor [Salinibacillus aidingensis]|uniref:metal-sulfur cluster assembly factor n=1 Tax=Salinibacillus aidingensis TaxID=237684 RepID=UPI0031E2D324